MASNLGRSHGATAPADIPDDSDGLVELVDDAAKALSIGGSLQSASEVRRAVDSLKHQFGADD